MSLAPVETLPALSVSCENEDRLPSQADHDGSLFVERLAGLGRLARRIQRCLVLLQRAEGVRAGKVEERVGDSALEQSQTSQAESFAGTDGCLSAQERLIAHLQHTTRTRLRA